jgi:AcrR family transcriptional regulator
VLAERGYEGATIKEIARAAQVAPGLVHYYFAGKEELFAEMLREESRRYTTDMTSLAGRVPRENLVRLALTEPRERVERQPEWYRLRAELLAQALHTPALVPGMQALLGSGRAGIASVADRALGAHADAEALSAVLLACFDGLATQKLIDPSVDLDAAYSVLTRMVESLRSTA